MSMRDRFLAVLVAVLWGLNFLAVRIDLDYFPPFFLAALRYLVLAVPVMLLVPRPDVPLHWLLGYGLGFGTVQFAFLFLAIDVGMPTGLSSLVIQSSAPLTVLMSGLLLHERVSARQVGGISLAGLGMIIIAWDRAQTAALLPVVLTVIGAFGWAVGNLASRQAKPSHPLRFALWMSVVPPLPLLALSAALEGPAAGWHAVWASFSAQGWPGLLALGYIVVAGTVLGSWIWLALLGRYPAGTVAPFSMLVPVVGIAAAAVALNEQPSILALSGGAVVIAGVLLGTRQTDRTRLRGEAVDAACVPSPQSERQVV
jgi:drug/metabolite transporter (DMT)-like permease